MYKSLKELKKCYFCKKDTNCYLIFDYKKIKIRSLKIKYPLKIDFNTLKFKSKKNILIECLCEHCKSEKIYRLSSNKPSTLEKIKLLKVSFKENDVNYINNYLTNTTVVITNNYDLFKTTLVDLDFNDLLKFKNKISMKRILQ